MAPYCILHPTCWIPYLKYFFYSWHFHKIWCTPRHGISMRRVNSTRRNISMKQNARSITHADVPILTTRDPSNLAIELCNGCLLEQPSISEMVTWLAVMCTCMLFIVWLVLYLPCNHTSCRYMYGTALMQLHTREVNTRMCEGLFTWVIKPNPLSQGNSLDNLLNLVIICFFSSNSALLEGFVEELPLSTIE